MSSQCSTSVVQSDLCHKNSESDLSSRLINRVIPHVVMTFVQRVSYVGTHCITLCGFGRDQRNVFSDMSERCFLQEKKKRKNRLSPFVKHRIVHIYLDRCVRNCESDYYLFPMI